MRQILTSRLSLSKHLAHNLGNLLLLGKIGVFHNRRNASSRLLLLISKHLILCIYLVFRILAWSRRLNASNLFLSLILHLGNLFLIVQLHFSKLFLILKSGVNHTSRGSISTSTLPSIKLRKCSSKIITSILSFISGRDRKSGSAGMPRPSSYAVFCLKKKKRGATSHLEYQRLRTMSTEPVSKFARLPIPFVIPRRQT